MSGECLAVLSGDAVETRLETTMRLRGYVLSAHRFDGTVICTLGCVDTDCINRIQCITVTS